MKLKKSTPYLKFFYGVILLLIFCVIALFFYYSLSMTKNNAYENSGVILAVHSKIDRPILGYSVNGVYGSNTFAHDPNNPYSGQGANVTCCGVIKGETALIKWTLDTTGAQYEAGMRPENRQIEIPLPPRQIGENILHVHFLPNNKIYLVWSDSLTSPYDAKHSISSAIKVENGESHGR